MLSYRGVAYEAACGVGYYHGILLERQLGIGRLIVSLKNQRKFDDQHL